LVRLPRHSHYKAALDENEELARLSLELTSGVTGGKPGKPYVPLVGYDENAVRLDNLLDAINALHETVVRRWSRRGARVGSNRAPRPVTAQERVKHEKAMEKLSNLEQQVLGGR